MKWVSISHCNDSALGPIMPTNCKKLIQFLKIPTLSKFKYLLASDTAKMFHCIVVPGVLTPVDIVLIECTISID